MSYKDLKEFAADNKMKVNVLAWGYANRYDENGKWIRQDKVPNWVRLDPDWHAKTGWEKFSAKINWVLINIYWWYNSVKRHIHNIPKLWRLHCKCKKWNKYLLAEAERTKSLGPAAPPKPEDVAHFIKSAENAGIRFGTMVQPLPRTPLMSRVDIDINELD